MKNFLIHLLRGISYATILLFAGITSVTFIRLHVSGSGITNADMFLDIIMLVVPMIFVMMVHAGATTRGGSHLSSGSDNLSTLSRSSRMIQDLIIISILLFLGILPLVLYFGAIYLFLG